MFAARFFPAAFYAPRYFAEAGATAVVAAASGGLGHRVGSTTPGTAHRSGPIAPSTGHRTT